MFHYRLFFRLGLHNHPLHHIQMPLISLPIGRLHLVRSDDRLRIPFVLHFLVVVGHMLVLGLLVLLQGHVLWQFLGIRHLHLYHTMLHKMLLMVILMLGVVVVVQKNYIVLFPLVVLVVVMVLFLQDGMEQVAHLLHLQRHRVHLQGLQLVPLPLVMEVVHMVVVEVVTLLQDHLVQSSQAVVYM